MMALIPFSPVEISDIMSLLTNFINSPYSFETIMTYIITPFSKFNDKIHPKRISRFRRAIFWL